MPFENIRFGISIHRPSQGNPKTGLKLVPKQLPEKCYKNRDLANPKTFPLYIYVSINI
jgi:hypothetical protein